MRPEPGRRLLAWGAAAALLLLPLVAMQFTEEVNWTVFDFLVFGSMLAVAVFDVTSVRKMVTTAMTTTKRSQCVPARKSSRLPIHSVRPESWNPCASAKPPPKSRTMFQGRRSAVCQSMMRAPRSARAGIRNSRMAMATATTPSAAELQSS